MLFPLLLWTTLLCRFSDGQFSDYRDLVINESPMFSVLAPAKIRPGTKQNILLEGHKLSQALTVSIRIYDYPASETVLMMGSVILSLDNNYSALTTIEIDPNLLQPDGNKKYVKLVAQFGTYHNAERVLPVSFHSGYIFIQTDKPVYNPGDTVHCRAFVSDTEFHAAEKTISLEIQNPDGITVHDTFRAKAIDGILSNSYTLSSVVKEGKWKVVAEFDQGKKNIFSREFEVKKYVLPAFNVTLTPKTSYLRLDAEKLEVVVTARYLYGEPVKGVAYVLFGIEVNGEKKRLTSIKQLNDLNGGIVSLTMEEIKKVHPDLNSLLGSSVYVKASVMTSSGSDLVEAEKSGIKIVMSPYVLSIKDTPKYFKPGLPLGIVVTVSDHNGSPAQNIPVKISFLKNPMTEHSGTIKVYIDMPEMYIAQKLKVETADPSLKPEQQAIKEMHVDPYMSFQGYRNYLHISMGSSRVVVGDTVNFHAHIKCDKPERKQLVEQLTYAVLCKGNIIHAVRKNVKDLDIINIPLVVTTEMLPAFRFVAYYILPWQHSAEVVADSVFIDVEDRCVGSLSVGTVEGEELTTYLPGSNITFEVKGDPGAMVSLVAVDNAIFLLSKNRLTMNSMECKQQLKWLMLAMICPLIAGAPSSMSKSDSSCPEENLSITGGTFVLSNGYTHGSLLRYICPNGYYPSVRSRLCQYGLWTSTTKIRKTPECKKITCPNPHVFKKGEVTPYKDKYYVNDTTSYSCPSDYMFRGSAVRVCKPNGKWSGSTPICGHNSDHCPDPGVPPGSNRIGSIFHTGNKVTYRCESPLTLIGSKVRVCQDGGQWSGTEPQCYADFTYDSPEEASDAFASSLKMSLAVSDLYKKEAQGKKIILDEDGRLDIYFAVDASDSIDPEDFYKAKATIKTLIEKITYYPVSPNYEILIFTTDVTPIIKLRNFKLNKNERSLERIFEDLDKFTYESKGGKTGTNISKVYAEILESMKTEELDNPTAFSETQHIIIVFTDGQANMEGNAKHKVDQIKRLVTKNNPSRDNKLDLYVFGVGDDVYQEDINDLVSQKDLEKHFFKLQDLTNVPEMFDEIIDESTSVELCGVVSEGLENKRHAFPWLAEINIIRSSKVSNCMGSLVSSRYILTAAHCFDEGDTPDKITVKLEKDLAVKVKKYTVHPDFNLTAKQHMGIQGYYEFDVALIQLEYPVRITPNIQPICIPCTKETNAALKLSESEGTCRKHEEILMSNMLVEAAFASEMDTDNIPKIIKRITIKLGKYRDACVEDAKKAKGINVKNASEVVTDNFLCSGGNQPRTDDVACKGDGGGATYVNKKGRVIQVGVISWGVNDICKEKSGFSSESDSRDYHSNLFSEKIRSFLKEHLENDDMGNPLTFL